ncbi:hypothetical protein ACLOJK_018336 [Asimina triloba]
MKLVDASCSQLEDLLLQPTFENAPLLGNVSLKVIFWHLDERPRHAVRFPAELMKLFTLKDDESLCCLQQPDQRNLSSTTELPTEEQENLLLTVTTL